MISIVFPIFGSFCNAMLSGIIWKGREGRICRLLGVEVQGAYGQRCRKEKNGIIRKFPSELPWSQEGRSCCVNLLTWFIGWQWVISWVIPLFRHYAMFDTILYKGLEYLQGSWNQSPIDFER